MSKTFRGNEKERLKDRYKQVREERQNKRHTKEERKTSDDEKKTERR